MEAGQKVKTPDGIGWVDVALQSKAYVIFERNQTPARPADAGWYGLDVLEKLDDDVGIRGLQLRAHRTAEKKGWWDEPREIGTLIALMHSELSEALEAEREGDREHLVEELADVVIRILDFCGAYDLDLQAAILDKMDVNEDRSHKHGGKKF